MWVLKLNIHRKWYLNTKAENEVMVVGSYLKLLDDTTAIVIADEEMRAFQVRLLDEVAKD